MFEAISVVNILLTCSKLLFYFGEKACSGTSDKKFDLLRLWMYVEQPSNPANVYIFKVKKKFEISS